MMVSFVTAAVLLWIIYLLRISNENGRILPELQKVKTTFLNITMAAAASTAGNRLALHSAGRIDASVMFPVMNGGILILCTMAAVVLFKEKLTKRQQFGMAIGIASVILISM